MNKAFYSLILPLCLSTCWLNPMADSINNAIGIETAGSMGTKVYVEFNSDLTGTTEFVRKLYMKENKSDKFNYNKPVKCSNIADENKNDICRTPELLPFRSYYFNMQAYYKGNPDRDGNTEEVELETYLNDKQNENSFIRKYFSDSNNLQLLYDLNNIFIYNINKAGLLSILKINKNDFTACSTFGNNGIFVNSFTTAVYLFEGKLYFSQKSTDSNFILNSLSAETGSVTNTETISLSSLKLNLKKIIYIDDGRIIALCESYEKTENSGYTIVKINRSDGKLDMSFGSDGKASFDYRYDVTQAVYYNNYIFTCGYIHGSLILQKIDISNGTLDGNFMTNGTYIVKCNNSTSDYLNSIKILLNGNELYVLLNTGLKNIAIEKRSCQNGSLFKDFGTEGTIIFSTMADYLKGQKNFILYYNSVSVYKNSLLVKIKNRNSYLYNIVAFDKDTGNPLSAYGLHNTCLEETSEIFTDNEYIYAVPENFCKIKNFMKN